MNYIEALADCIMLFEGWKQPSIPFPRGSTSWRNRNPGNLRDSYYKSGEDQRGYATFESLDIGWKALRTDLTAKFTFPNSHGLTGASTLHDLFSIYAPALDSNDPQQYSRMVAQWLTMIYQQTITADTTLADIMKLS